MTNADKVREVLEKVKVVTKELDEVFALVATLPDKDFIGKVRILTGMLETHTILLKDVSDVNG